MQIEQLVSQMMTINTKARLWHWMTDIAQHHVTYEQFLTQNETHTDSFMESAMGNDYGVELGKIAVTEANEAAYSIDSSREQLKNFRAMIIEAKNTLEASEKDGSQELVTILDDVVELSSKTLYLLRLK